MKLGQNLITAGILAAAGTYKICKDYVEAPDEHKNRTLIRESAALGVAALTVFATDKYIVSKLNSRSFQYFSHRISKSILNNKFVKKITQKVFPQKNLQPVRLQILSDIVSNCTKNIIHLLAAGLSGISAGVIVDKILSKIKKAVKNDKEQIENQNKHAAPDSIIKLLNNPVFTTVSGDKSKYLMINAVKVFEAAGLISNPFEFPSVVLSGIDMSGKKNFKKIIEQTSLGIIAETFITSFCVSVANALTKNKSWYLKLPAIATGFYLGDFTGSKIAKMMTKEVEVK